MVNRMRTCHIHAGTHKTASSYIQSRLSQNRELLARHGLVYDFPGHPKFKYKPLVRAANRGAWERWDRYLKRHRHHGESLLLSAEQFTRPLCNPDLLGGIRDILTRHGFDLHVVIFVRPQLEYINSRYVYDLRCLRHSLSFEDYVQASLASQSGDFFNYWQFYAPLLEAGVRCTFLPFSRQYGDPFLQLMQALGLDVGLGYAAAAPGRDNVQHGARGVWLSRLVVERLGRLGQSGQALKKASKVMRRISEEQGWHEERYFGFSDELALRTLNHYQAGNESFARLVWNRSWSEVFPPRPIKQCLYTPVSSEDERKLRILADRTMAELASRNPGLARAMRAAG